MNGVGVALAVAAAGAVGALARVLLDDAWIAWRERRSQGTQRRWAAWSSWPWALLAVNVLGSLVLGWSTGLAALHPAWAAIIGAGFCGGLTTFSTWAVVIAGAAHDRRWRTAVGVAVGHLVLGGLAAWCGVVLAG